MIDYLADRPEQDLLEQTRELERISTAGEKTVEKQGAQPPPLLAQVRRTEAVFHPLCSGWGQPNALSRPGERSRGELRPFPPLSPFAQQTGAADAEAVDLAFQRDSRRYDSGFFLY